MSTLGGLGQGLQMSTTVSGFFTWFPGIKLRSSGSPTPPSFWHTVFHWLRTYWGKARLAAKKPKESTSPELGGWVCVTTPSFSCMVLGNTWQVFRFARQHFHTPRADSWIELKIATLMSTRIFFRFFSGKTEYYDMFLNLFHLCLCQGLSISALLMLETRQFFILCLQHPYIYPLDAKNTFSSGSYRSNSSRHCQMSPGERASWSESHHFRLNKKWAFVNFRKGHSITHWGGVFN